MKRHKRYNGHSRALSQTRTLRSLELGASIPSRLAFRAEIADFTNLRAVDKGIYPSSFSNGRNAYISQLVPSPDKALLAIASSDGRIEVHEPADTETRRLEILPIPGTKLSSVAWGSNSSSDYLLIGLKESFVALYDLNTCQSNRPTRKFHHTGRHLSDIITLGTNTFAMASRNRIETFDARVNGSTGHIPTADIDAVLTGEDIFLYAADNGTVTLWDRRKLASQRDLGIMTKRNDKALSRVTFTTGRFNDIRLIPNTAPGCLFFHQLDGTIGQLDIVSKEVESIPEDGIDIRVMQSGESGLNPYGTAEQSFNRPWYVHRRRIDIISAATGPGWRAIIPNVKTGGYRLVGFAPDMSIQAYFGARSNSTHYCCTHACEGRLEQIILGDSQNRVKALEVSVN